MMVGAALVPILHRQALAAFSNGQTDEALDLAARILSSHPDHAGANNLAGIIAVSRGDNDAAIRFLSAALATKPDYYEAAYNLGQAHRDNENNADALKAYQLAAQLRPDIADVQICLSFAALCEGALDLGRKAAHAALKIDATSNEAARLTAIGDLMDGVLSFKEADTLRLIREAKAPEQLEEARALLLDLYEKHPRQLDIAHDLAALYLAGDQIDEAMSVLSPLKDEDKRGMIDLLWADILCRKGNCEEALDWLLLRAESWTKIDFGEFQQVLVQLAAWDPDRAVAVLGRVQAAGKLGLDARSMLFWNSCVALVRAGAWNAAKAVAREGTEIDPDDHALANAYLETLLETGEFEAAELQNATWFAKRFDQSETVQNDASFTLEWELVVFGQFGTARRIRDERVLPFLEKRGGPLGAAQLSFEYSVEADGIYLPRAVPLKQFELELTKRERDFKRSAEGMPRFRLVHTLCVRDELELIEANLAYHFKAGVDCAIVTDNGSVDGTREKLQELAQRWPILIIDEPKMDYDQTHWTTRMGYLARDVLGAEWVIMGDADEFWQAPGDDLPGGLSRCLAGPFSGPSQVFFRNILMVPEFDRAQSKDYRFYEATSAFDRPLANIDYHWISIEHSIAHLLTSFNKTVVKASDVRLVAPGNHWALCTTGNFAYSDELDCLHYHIRSFDHFRKKTQRNFEALSTGDEVHRQVAHSLLTLYRQLEANNSYLPTFKRKTLANPFMDYAGKVGRIKEHLEIKAFVEAGLPVPALSPLPQRLVELSNRYLDSVEDFLPRFVPTDVTP